MGEASPNRQVAPQEFEATLAAASAAQAQFEEERLDFLQRVQRFLHLYPTTVPFIVLLLGLALGVSVNYSHFVTGSNLSTVLTQVTIVGILGIGQTLVILTAGIDLSVGVIMVISSVVMGRLGVIDGLPIFLAFPIGLSDGRRVRRAQRLLRDAHADAAVHRHPRHAHRSSARSTPSTRRARPSGCRTSTPRRRSCS